jgi:hypothetical protein
MRIIQILGTNYRVHLTIWAAYYKVKMESNISFSIWVQSRRDLRKILYTKHPQLLLRCIPWHCQCRQVCHVYKHFLYHSQITLLPDVFKLLCPQKQNSIWEMQIQKPKSRSSKKKGWGIDSSHIWIKSSEMDQIFWNNKNLTSGWVDNNIFRFGSFQSNPSSMGGSIHC